MWWKGMVSGWPVSAINGKDYFALDNRSACNLFPQNWNVPIIQKARWLDSMGTSMGVQRKLDAARSDCDHHERLWELDDGK
jgi:hypothetical protein